MKGHSPASANFPAQRGKMTTPLGHTSFSWLGNAPSVPLGHTSFSWYGWEFNLSLSCWNHANSHFSKGVRGRNTRRKKRRRESRNLANQKCPKWVKLRNPRLQNRLDRLHSSLSLCWTA